MKWADGRIFTSVRPKLSKSALLALQLGFDEQHSEEYRPLSWAGDQALRQR